MPLAPRACAAAAASPPHLPRRRSSRSTFAPRAASLCCPPHRWVSARALLPPRALPPPRRISHAAGRVVSLCSARVAELAAPRAASLWTPRHSAGCRRAGCCRRLQPSFSPPSPPSLPCRRLSAHRVMSFSLMHPSRVKRLAPARLVPRACGARALAPCACAALGARPATSAPHLLRCRCSRTPRAVLFSLARHDRRPRAGASVRRVCESIPLGGVPRMCCVCHAAGPGAHRVVALFWRAAVRQATCASARRSHSELVRPETSRRCPSHLPCFRRAPLARRLGVSRLRERVCDR